MNSEFNYAVPFSHPDELTDYVVIDLETTGLNPNFCEIIQLASIRVVNNEEVGSFSTFIHPNKPIPKVVSNLTGITDDTVSGAPNIEEVFDDFMQFIFSSPFVTGWNVSFDLSFLSYYANQDLTHFLQWFDTMVLFRRAEKLSKYRLADACERIGYSSSFHDALEDCRACSNVLSWLCQNNRLDHALHSKAEKSAALSDYFKKRSSGVCPVDVSTVNRNGVLDGKTIVFTGALSFARASAKELAEAAGASVKTSVSKKTNYLVVGEQDEVLVGCNGMSTKEERASELNAAGAGISVITEQEFLELL